MANYSFPLPFSKLIKMKSLSKIELYASIKNNIYLTLMTRLGSCRFNKDFGCIIWDKDFIVYTNKELWRNELKENIERSITLNEPRINPESIRVTIAEKEIEEETKGGRNIKIRRMLSIGLTSNLKDLNAELPTMEFNFFFSPLSLD